MKLLIVALFALIASNAHAKATSEYTRLDQCKTIMSSENDPEAQVDYFSEICKGRDGFRVLVEGGDSRSWINLLPRGEKIPSVIDSGISMAGEQGFFPNISGKTLEWRYNDGQLNALIIRTSGMDPETDRSLEHLTVIRVNTTNVNKSCVIAVVNARQSNANAKARAAADSATARCL